MRPVLCILFLVATLSGCAPPHAGGPIYATPEEFSKGWIGQSKQALLDAYGKPDKIDTPIFDNGTAEEWRYRHLVQHPESQTPYGTARFTVEKKTGRIRSVHVY